MARFTNYATLSFNGGTTDSNTVTGELVEILTASKTAVSADYTANDDITYVLSLVNSGTAALTGLTVTDDLGGYTFNGAAVYPLEYTAGSVRYYLNGVLQSAPTAEAGPPLVFTGISVPAGGTAMLIYEASVTGYAPLGTEAEITNSAVISGGGLSSPLTAEETIAMEARPNLSISKALCPATVTEAGQLTYTFVIENAGSIAADAADEIVLTDVFQPVLSGLSVTLDGTALTGGTDYTYDQTTGSFATAAGRITVPAAAYAQGENGIWTVTPGTATLTITGTV